MKMYKKKKKTKTKTNTIHTHKLKQQQQQKKRAIIFNEPFHSKDHISIHPYCLATQFLQCKFG